MAHRALYVCHPLGLSSDAYRACRRCPPLPTPAPVASLRSSSPRCLVLLRIHSRVHPRERSHHPSTVASPPPPPAPTTPDPRIHNSQQRPPPANNSPYFFSASPQKDVETCATRPPPVASAMRPPRVSPVDLLRFAPAPRPSSRNVLRRFVRARLSERLAPSQTPPTVALTQVPARVSPSPRGRLHRSMPVSFSNTRTGYTSLPCVGHHGHARARPRPCFHATASSDDTPTTHLDLTRCPSP